MSDNDVIKVEGLNKTFKKTIKQKGLAGSFRALFKPETVSFEAVKDLTFSIPRGQIFGFIGANGAGS